MACDHRVVSSIGTGPTRVPSRRLRSIRQHTQKVLAGEEPPTHQIALRTRDILDNDVVANDVLDLTLRLGEAMLSVGAPVADVTATSLRVAAAYGLTSCQVDITFTSIAVAVTRDDGDPMTGVRVAKVRTADYSRLAALTDLAAKIANEDLPLPDALERLDSIVHAPHPYRRSLATAALAAMAACIAGLMGGGWVAAAIAAITTAALDRMLRRMHIWGLPAFFQHAAGGGLAALVAVGILLSEQELAVGAEPLRPAMVVASGIIVLLAGMATVGAAQDALSGFYLTAAARSFEVLLLSAGVVVGVGGVLRIADALHVDIPQLDDLPTPDLSLPVQLLLACGVAGCWAAASYARLRALPVAMAAGGVAFGLYWLCASLGTGPTLASGIAAAGVGAFADFVGTRVGTPALVVSICGVTPLLPGLAVYRALAKIVAGDSGAGLELMFHALSIGLALAAGVALGAFLIQPLSSGYDRFDRRVRRRARGATWD